MDDLHQCRKQKSKSYAETVLETPGLVAFFKCDEPPGTRLADSVNPTPEAIRDRIHDTLPTGELWGKQAKHKKVGSDELVVIHPSGKKFKVKVSEIVD